MKEVKDNTETHYLVCHHSLVQHNHTHIRGHAQLVERVVRTTDKSFLSYSEHHTRQTVHDLRRIWTKMELSM